MYEYQFISVESDWHLLANRSLERHRDIIQEQAEQGWRFAGCVPTQSNSDGVPIEVDLVFERALK